ncbi:MAG: hypothetical protein AB4063_07645 [Crocosphaera sp.]
MGTNKSGRPGGNPNIKEFGFKQKYHWDEPCSEKMTIRLPPFMKEAIKAGIIDDWQEVCRQAIAAELDKHPPEEGDNTN